MVVTFTSRVKDTLRTEGIQITLYFIMSSIVHSWFNSNAPALVPICYYVIKHGWRCFSS